MISDHLKNLHTKFLLLEQKCGLALVVYAFVLFGAISLVKYHFPSKLWIGVSLPLLYLCIIEVAKGMQLIVVNKKRLTEWHQLDPEDLGLYMRTERKRLTVVEKNLKKLEYVFMLLIFFGFILIFLGIFVKWGDFAIGNGVGVLLPSAFIYIVDLYRSFNVGTHLSHLKKRPQ